MAGVREVFEIVDQATAPLRNIGDAFASASRMAEQASQTGRGASEAATQQAQAYASQQTIVDALRGAVNALNQTVEAQQGYTNALTSQMANLSSTGAQATDAVNRLTDSLKQSATAGQQMGTEMTTAAEEMAQVGKESEKSGEGIGKSTQEMTKAAKVAELLKGKLSKLALAYASLKTVQAGIALSDELSMAQARLNGLTGDLAETERLQNLIYQAAQRSRSAYDETMQTVTSLKAQTGDTFSSIEEAAAFVETLQKQFKLAGADANAISSTMYNLTQALSTGVLRGQDLNIVMANAPQIAQRVADKMGITVGELKEVASQGKVNADIVKSAMLGAADEIDEQFKDLPKTFGDVMTQAKNMGIRAFQPIADVISGIINSPQVQGAIEALGTGLYFVASIVGIVMQGIANVFGFIGTIFGNLFTIVSNFCGQVINVGNLFVALSTVVGAVLGGIGNMIGIVANFFIDAWENSYNNFVIVTHGMVTSFAKAGSKIVGAFAGVARSADAAATAIANAFIAGANAAIGGINGLINAINQIPGVNLSTVGTVSQVGGFGFADAVQAAQAGLDAIANSAAPEAVHLERFDTTGLIEGFTNGADAGKNWAEGVLNGMGGQADFGNMNDLLSDIATNTGNAVPNGSGGKVGKVGKVEEAKLSDEDMKIYRDLAERRYMNNIELKTLAPEINVTLPANASGNITAQDVADRLKKMLIEQMAAQTAVAHG